MLTVNITCMLNCFSHVWLFATMWTVARQAPLSTGFSRQEYWSGLPCPPPGDFSNPGIEPVSPALQVDSLPLSHRGSPSVNITVIYFHANTKPVKQVTLQTWIQWWAQKEGELRSQCWAGGQASEPALQGPQSLPGCPIIHKPWTFGALQDYLKLSRN